MTTKATNVQSLSHQSFVIFIPFKPEHFLRQPVSQSVSRRFFLDKMFKTKTRRSTRKDGVPAMTKLMVPLIASSSFMTFLAFRTALASSLLIALVVCGSCLKLSCLNCCVSRLICCVSRLNCCVSRIICCVSRLICCVSRLNCCASSLNC